MAGASSSTAARTAAGQVQRVVAACLAYVALLRQGTDGLVFVPFDRLAAYAERVSALAATVGWPVDARGKPFAQGAMTAQGRRFVSLSHTDTLAAAAVAAVPVGVDIEGNIAPARVQRLMRKLSPDEAAWGTLSDAALSLVGTQWWTVRESVGKLTGEGLRLSSPPTIPVEQRSYFLGTAVVTAVTQRIPQKG